MDVTDGKVSSTSSCFPGGTVSGLSHCRGSARVDGDIACLLVGGNDVDTPGTRAEEIVDQYEALLKEYLGKKKVVVMSLLPRVNHRENARVQQVNHQLEELCVKHDVPFSHVQSLPRALFKDDGKHLTWSGKKKVVKDLLHEITQK